MNRFERAYADRINTSGQIGTNLVQELSSRPGGKSHFNIRVNPVTNSAWIGCSRCKSVHCPHINEWVNLKSRRLFVTILDLFTENGGTPVPDYISLLMPLDCEILAHIVLRNRDGSNFYSVWLEAEFLLVAADTNPLLEDLESLFDAEADGVATLHMMVENFLRGKYLDGKHSCQSTSHYRLGRPNVISSLEDAVAYWIERKCSGCIAYGRAVQSTGDDLVPQREENFRKFKPASPYTAALE